MVSITRSFASHSMAKYWAADNELTARECFLNSNTKRSFICENNHKFSMSVWHVASGQWCGVCKTPSERIIYEYLSVKYPDIQSQARYDWCKNSNGRYLFFDLVIEKYKIIIEIDGAQHFKDIPYWNSSVSVVNQTDMFKLRVALQNGYTMIRILASDLINKSNNKTNWKFNLDLAIECMKRDMYCYSLIASDEQIYDNHRFVELEY